MGSEIKGLILIRLLANQLLFKIQRNDLVCANEVVILDTGHNLIFYPTEVIT